MNKSHENSKPLILLLLYNLYRLYQKHLNGVITLSSNTMNLAQILILYPCA